MASRASIVEYLVEQLGAGVSAKAMFGEYGVYRRGVLIGLICDDRLFLKQTASARALLGEGVQEAPAYPGAKPSLVVPEERWDDGEFLAELARVTAEGLPAPKPRPAAKRSQAKGVHARADGKGSAKAAPAAAAKPRTAAAAKAKPRTAAKAKPRAAKPRSAAKAKPRAAKPRSAAKAKRPG